MRLGRALRDTGRLEEAQSILEKAVALQSTLADRYPEASSYRVWKAVVQESLARVLGKRNEPAEARSLLESSVSILADLLKDDREARKRGQIRGLLAMYSRTLAGVLTDLGEEDRAAEVLRRAEEEGLRFGPPPGAMPGRPTRR